MSINSRLQFFSKIFKRSSDLETYMSKASGKSARTAAGAVIDVIPPSDVDRQDYPTPPTPYLTERYEKEFGLAIASSAEGCDANLKSRMDSMKNGGKRFERRTPSGEIEVVYTTGESRWAEKTFNYITRFDGLTITPTGTIAIYVSGTGTGNIEYSFDNFTWTAMPSTSQTQVTVDKPMYIRGVNTARLGKQFKMSGTGTVALSGSIMSLIDGKGATIELPNVNNMFWGLFNSCSQVTDVSNLRLPATILKQGCYAYMLGSTGITSLPALPATTLATGCYEQLFSGCIGITEIPSGYLPDTVAQGCYQNMFSSCSNLETVPEDLLPATTLAESCYQNMFRSCSKITQAPSLPAESTANNCYYGMFANCSALASVPSLPSQTVSSGCYYDMFYQCTSLTSVPTDLLPAQNLASSCYTEMFYGCTSLTNFPLLSITSVDSYCCQSMFFGCNKVTVLPEGFSLSANTLATNCYLSMFKNCSALTSVPTDLLPAQNLASSCYNQMFANCSALVTGPNLPATGSLKQRCYNGMFESCGSLAGPITISTTDTPSTWSTNFMFTYSGTAEGAGGIIYVPTAKSSSWNSANAGITTPPWTVTGV